MNKLIRKLTSRPGQLILVLLAFGLLSACASSGHSSHHRQQSYASSHYPGYPQSYRTYYGRYPSGWFAGAPYPGIYFRPNFYPGFGYAGYWPGYANSYGYQNYYYPYYDPWYYSQSSWHRYSHYYGYPGYRGYGNGYGYGHAPYYGSSHSYRPPGSNQAPAYGERPAPRVIPPQERGNRRGGGGPSDDYNDPVDAGASYRETHVLDRRSSTTIVEQQGMSRSVSVAPGSGTADQGMVVTSRSDRKIAPSRLEPVSVSPADSSPVPLPRQSRRAESVTAAPSVSLAPTTSVQPSRGYSVPADRAEPMQPSTRPSRQRYSSRQQPVQVAPAQVAEPRYSASPPARPSESYQQAPAAIPPPASRQAPSATNLGNQRAGRRGDNAERDQERD